MAEILVIGYGNPLEDDGGLGWQVAQHLKTDDIDGEVEILNRRLLLPELAEKICRSQLVIFVDVVDEGEPGTIMSRSITTGVALYPVFSHAYDPMAFLSWIQQFYGHRPESFLVSLVGAYFNHAKTLTPGLVASLPPLLNRIRFLILAHLNRIKSGGKASGTQPPALLAASAV